MCGVAAEIWQDYFWNIRKKIHLCGVFLWHYDFHLLHTTKVVKFFREIARIKRIKMWLWKGVLFDPIPIRNCLIKHHDFFFIKYANSIKVQMNPFFHWYYIKPEKKTILSLIELRSLDYLKGSGGGRKKKGTNFRFQSFKKRLWRAKKRVSNLICQTVRQGCLRLYGGHAGLEIMSCPLFHWLSPIHKWNHFMWNWWIGEFAKRWIGYDFRLRFQMTGSDRMAQGILLHE